MDEFGQVRKKAAISPSKCVCLFYKVWCNMKEKYMMQAIEQAKKAGGEDEVPIGCVIVCDGKIVGYGHNTKEQQQQPCGHAEINAITMAANNKRSWRLNDCDLYVTLEPCLMCAGTIIQSRINKVYYGAKDIKGGAFGSTIDILEIKGLNHYPQVEKGIMEEECSKLLSSFFENKRKTTKKQSKLI